MCSRPSDSRVCLVQFSCEAAANPAECRLENGNMLDLLKSMLTGQNAFASGGLLLMAIGGLSVYLRAVPNKLWDWIAGQTTMIITVKDDDAAFVWVKEWFLEQRFLTRVRRVDLDTTMRSERIALIPAPGIHWFWYRRRPFVVFFYRSEDSRERIARRSESLTFRTLGRDRGFLQHFVDDVVACHIRRLGVQSRLFAYNEGWDVVEGYAPRLLSSVILQPGEKEYLVQDIERFRRSRARYERLGVPYHRGYLFYGPPGTGKTSVASALAAHFGLSIYSVNLGDFNDRTLMNAVNQVAPNSVLLFEDIDCMKTATTRGLSNADPENGGHARRENEATADRNAVTLSGLLNVLDGFYAPTNVLFMMTTNRIESLDEALLRPGRIDYKLYLGKANARQKIELYRRFFPESSESEAEAFVETCASAETMAEFQGLLLGLLQELGSWELVGSACV
jgi:mitochondrial chaperone BCS1